MRLTIVFVLCFTVVSCWHFLGFRKFIKIINKDLLKGVEENSLEQDMFGNGTKAYTVEEICSRLSELHNQVQNPKLHSNRQFLNLKNPLATDGFHVISTKGCIDALRDPKYHKYSDWLDEYSGFHVGKRLDDGGIVEDTIQWFAVDKKYFQTIRYLSRCEQKRCDCTKKDPKNKNDCSWGWNYPGKDMKMPYTYHWDPENDKTGGGRNGVYLGFNYQLRNVGFKKAECLVLFGYHNSCIQCFNRYENPHRTTIACYHGSGQYEIVQERPDPVKQKAKMIKGIFDEIR